MRWVIPSLMWQVTGVIEWQARPAPPQGRAGTFLRFLEDQLGWQNYRWEEAFAHPDGLVDGDVVYVRCAGGDATDRYRVPDPATPGLPADAPTTADTRP